MQSAADVSRVVLVLQSDFSGLLLRFAGLVIGEGVATNGFVRFTYILLELRFIFFGKFSGAREIRISN